MMHLQVTRLSPKRTPSEAYWGDRRSTCSAGLLPLLRMGVERSTLRTASVPLCGHTTQGVNIWDGWGGKAVGPGSSDTSAISRFRTTDSWFEELSKFPNFTV